MSERGADTLNPRLAGCSYGGRCHDRETTDAHSFRVNADSLRSLPSSVRDPMLRQMADDMRADAARRLEPLSAVYWRDMPESSLYGGRVISNTSTVVTVRRSLWWRLRRPWIAVRCRYRVWRLERRGWR